MILVVAIFLWRRYAVLLRSRVKVSKVVFADGVYYCTFVWQGRLYENGFFLPIKGYEKKSFYVRGYDVSNEAWQLEPLKI